MCEPVTIITLAGLALSAEMQIQAGQYQNALAKQNAAMDEAAAKDALGVGLVEAEGIAIKGGIATGGLKAKLGASGVTVNSGSPLEAIADSAQFAELDKRTAQSNAERQAWGLRAEAFNTLQEGKLAERSSYFRAASTMLVGGASAYGDYYKLR